MPDILKGNCFFTEQVHDDLHSGTYYSVIFSCISVVFGKGLECIAEVDKCIPDTRSRTFVKCDLQFFQACSLCIRCSELGNLRTVLGVKEWVAKLGDPGHIDTITYPGTVRRVVETAVSQI